MPLQLGFSERNHHALCALMRTVAVIPCVPAVKNSLVSGNIAEDVTAYYTVSEQIPTVCALGAVFDKGEVKAAGGFMVQLVPPVADSAVDCIEKNLKNMDSITEMLENGLDPEKIALSALEGLGGEILDSWDARTPPATSCLPSALEGSSALGFPAQHFTFPR